MAFNKRLWKGRQGTGLNKFSINGATPVTVINQPDSVTEQGDALSAGNLNDLEQRIYDAFDDIADGTQIVGKATADASGNVIDQTYETKADASNLKDAIQGNTARIENLEQEHGEYVTVNYRGDSAVPIGKAKYALVESIVGKSRAWNQLANELYIRPETYGLTREATSDGGIRIYGTCTSSTSFTVATMPSVTSGHSYLTSLGATLPTGCRISTSSDDKASSAVSTLSSSNFGIYVTSGLTIDITLYPICRDLTLIFPEGVPSTVAECVAKCPDILKYDAFRTSIVDTTVGGVKSVGVNIWDEEWEVGNIQAGSPVSSTQYFRSKNFIKVDPSVAYYLFSGTNDNIYVFEYLADLSYANVVTIIDSTNHTFTPSANTRYVRFADRSRVAYANNIQICLDSLPTAVKTTYHPYMTDTLSLPSPVTLRSAGSVEDTDELNVEVNGVARRRQTTRIGSYTFTGDETFTDRISTYGRVDFEGLQSVIKPSLDIGDILISGFKVVTAGATTSVATENQIAVTSDGRVLIQIPSESTLAGYKSYLQGRVLNYALDTESVTLLDPIENNTIQTEGGGTINTIQNNVYPDDSPAPTIDNSMDVGYLAL